MPLFDLLENGSLRPPPRAPLRELLSAPLAAPERPSPSGNQPEPAAAPEAVHEATAEVVEEAAEDRAALAVITAAGPLAAALVPPEHFQGVPCADLSAKAYAADEKAFRAWWITLSPRPLPVPTPDAIIARYVYAMADAGRKVSGINRALAGIAHLHRVHGERLYRGPLTQAAIEMVRYRLKKTPQAVVHKAAPIRPADLRRMLEIVEPYDRALLLLGWNAALRRGELAALNVGDITWPEEGLAVRLLFTKTADEDEVAVPYEDDLPELLDAFRTMRRHLAGRGSDPTRPLFLSGVDQRITDRYVNRVIKTAALDAGLDHPESFSGHSLRRGWITTASEAGVSLEDIMRRSRHKDVKTARGYIAQREKFKAAPRGLLKSA